MLILNLTFSKTSPLHTLFSLNIEMFCWIKLFAVINLNHVLIVLVKSFICDTVKSKINPIKKLEWLQFQ
jgi:hypothetical protein